LDENLIRLRQRSGRKVRFERPNGDHGEQFIVRDDTFSLPKEITKSDAWAARNERAHVFLGFRPNWHLGSKVIVEELDIPLEHPIDLTGRADSVIEAKILGVSFSWWATPLATFVAEIPIRAPLCKLQEFVLGFPFLPADTGGAYNEEVRCMEDAQSLSCGAFVVQFDLDGLIVELQDVHIVLHFVNASEFNPMAFELNRDAHLPAWVPAADIRPATADATSRS
jgi:hypothetical protein